MSDAPHERQAGPGVKYGELAQPLSASTDIDAVVEQYESALLRYVTHLIGNREDEAQDVVQEVFIKLYRQTQKNGQDCIDNVKCWLFRVAHNLAMDHGRKRGRRQRLQDEAMNDPVSIPTGGMGENVPSGVERREICDLAMDELQQLPETQKTVLLLKLIQGLTLREISEITGMKIGTVNYRMTQGLRTLGEKLKTLGAM